MTSPRIGVLLVGLLARTSAFAGECPANITAAAKKAYPAATITKCKAEKTSFEVKMQNKDKSIIELDISAKGEIEQVEEVIATSAVPAIVTKAFAAKYPKLTITKAEKQTKADKSVSYE